MAIQAQITEQLKAAMRAKDKQTLETLRLITAAVKQVEVDELIEVDDARLLAILDKLAKQRRESIQQFQAAGREDLVAQEQFELHLIQSYLPQQLSGDEIALLIETALIETGAKKMSDMGKVMSVLKPKLQGRADMGDVSRMIKSKLG